MLAEKTVNLSQTVVRIDMYCTVAIKKHPTLQLAFQRKKEKKGGKIAEATLRSQLSTY